MSDDKTKKGKQDRSRVNGNEDYEMDYFKNKLGVSIQEVAEAITATGSNDRKILEKYLKEKLNK